MNKTEQAFEEFAATTDFTIEEMIAHKMTWAEACKWQRTAISQSEAPAEQPEDERERFEAFCAQNAEKTHHKHPDGFAIWQAAKRDALTQAPQEPVVVTDELIEAVVQQIYGSAATKQEYQLARALLSLASSEGKKPCG